jgi:hypothetical protein
VARRGVPSSLDDLAAHESLAYPRRLISLDSGYGTCAPLIYGSITYAFKRM